MRLAGLQKLTLLDFPKTVACTVFTDGCNFRCPFCHNASLVLSEENPSFLAEEDLLSFLKKRTGVLEGVVFTGGEPLLHSDLPSLMEKIKQLGYKIKLDTNGTNPTALAMLIENGLVDRVAMDIKNAPEYYAETVGLPALDLEKIEQSKNLLLHQTIPFEFRTTVVKGLHDTEKLIQLAEWIAGDEEYYLQGFKDSGSLINAAGLSAFPKEEMLAFADAVRPYVPSVQVRGI
ncbi:MAG: anaerobic ribonucleoside-triphosphate reductase activating protein [Clostridia bacterium]|nr:anaerobic ribonucleoside-triphosphate reductase activating protein [Clostridia bacterium]